RRERPPRLRVDHRRGRSRASRGRIRFGDDRLPAASVGSVPARGRGVRTRACLRRGARSGRGGRRAQRGGQRSRGGVRPCGAFGQARAGRAARRLMEAPVVASVESWLVKIPIARPVRFSSGTWDQWNYVVVRVRSPGGQEGCAYGFLGEVPIDIMVTELV